VLRLTVNAEDVLHVTYSALDGAEPDRASDWVVVKKDWAGAAFEVNSNEKTITLSTAKLKAVIERESGALHYIAAEGTTGAARLGLDRAAEECGEVADDRQLPVAAAGGGERREDISCGGCVSYLWVA